MKNWKRDTLESTEALSKGEVERLLDGMGNQPKPDATSQEQPPMSKEMFTPTQSYEGEVLSEEEVKRLLNSMS